jgi:hypothetical protein
MLINFISAIFVCLGCANDDETRLIDEIVGRYQNNPEWFETCTEQEAKADLDRLKAIYGAGFSKSMFSYAQCDSPSFARLRQLFEAFPSEFQRYTPEQIDQKIIADKDNRRLALSILSNPDVDSAMSTLEEIFQQMATKLANIKETKAPDFIEMCFQQVYTGEIDLSIYPDAIWANIPDWGRAYLKLTARMSLLGVYVDQLMYGTGRIPPEICEDQLKEINFCLKLIAE